MAQTCARQGMANSFEAGLTIQGKLRKWGDERLRRAMSKAGVTRSDFDLKSYREVLLQAKLEKKADAEGIASMR